MEKSYRPFRCVSVCAAPQCRHYLSPFPIALSPLLFVCAEISLFSFCFPFDVSFFVLVLSMYSLSLSRFPSLTRAFYILSLVRSIQRLSIFKVVHVCLFSFGRFPFIRSTDFPFMWNVILSKSFSSNADSPCTKWISFLFAFCPVRDLCFEVVVVSTGAVVVSTLKDDPIYRQFLNGRNKTTVLVAICHSLECASTVVRAVFVTMDVGERTMTKNTFLPTRKIARWCSRYKTFYAKS